VVLMVTRLDGGRYRAGSAISSNLELHGFARGDSRNRGACRAGGDGLHASEIRDRRQIGQGFHSRLHQRIVGPGKAMVSLSKFVVTEKFVGARKEWPPSPPGGATGYVNVVASPVSRHDFPVVGHSGRKRFDRNTRESIEVFIQIGLQSHEVA